MRLRSSGKDEVRVSSPLFSRGFLRLSTTLTRTLSVCLIADRSVRNWTGIAECLYIHGKRLPGRAWWAGHVQGFVLYKPIAYNRR